MSVTLVNKEYSESVNTQKFYVRILTIPIVIYVYFIENLLLNQ